METTEALERLLVALLVGLLVGLDRERAEVRKGRRLFAGVRTFPLIALFGGALSLLLDAAGPRPLVTGLVAISAIALVSYLFKSGVAISIGAGRFRRDVALSLCGMALAAGTATWLVQLVR